MASPFVGRRDEILLLRDRVSRRSSTLTVVRGTPGIGVSRLIREALAPNPHLHFPVPLLPDADTRSALTRALALAGAEEGGAPHSGGVPDWPSLLTAATALAPAPASGEPPPFVLVLDDAHRLGAARAAVPPMVRAFARDLQRRSTPFHLVLAGTEPVGMAELAALDSAAGAGLELEDIVLGPLSPREIAPLVARWSPMERLTGWSILGGHPRRLASLPPRITLAAAVRDLVLDPDGPLHRAVPDLLERTFQSPSRYAAVLRGIAAGARSWGGIAASAPELEGGARLGPYVKGLQDRGLLEVRNSLDARPGSRARRYDLPDPLVRFWFTHVLPSLAELGAGGAARIWEEEVRPRLPLHVSSLLPRAARSWLERDAAPVLGAVAREAGALWGIEHEVELAGILRNGAAAYGLCRWDEAPLSEDDLDRLDGQLRATRYGFARETRHRILVGRGAMTDGLRSRVARNPTVHVVGVRELVGEE
jgi:hypothetical protein